MPLRVIEGSDQRPLPRFARPSAIVGFGCVFVLLILANSASAAGVPTIAITSPTNGSTLTGSILTITGTSTNATRIQVCLDATNCKDATGVASWSATIDISGLSVGTHNITACAFPVTGAPACAHILLTVGQSSTIIEVPVFVTTVDSALHTYVVPGLAIGGVVATAVIAFAPGAFRVGQGVVVALSTTLLVELAIRLLATPISWSYALLMGLLLAIGAVNTLWRPKSREG